MARAVKKPVLNMPLKIILTADGSSYFVQQQKKLVKLRTAENIDEYGLFLNAITVPSLQRMVLVNYVSKLEISMPEFKTYRKEIIDVSKMVIFSVLYRQFTAEVRSKIFESDVIKRHNRQNPQQSFDERTTASEAVLKIKLEESRQDLIDAKAKILQPVQQSILASKELTTEEQNISLLMAEKFLDNLDLMLWYVLVKFFRKDGFGNFIEIINNQLFRYLDKSKLAEYISLMVLELARYCENTNLRRTAKRFYGNTIDVNKTIFDPEMRKKLNSELLNGHEFVHIAWKLIPLVAPHAVTQTKLQVTLYNRDENFKNIKEVFSSMRSFDMSKRSLVDLYREVLSGDKTTNLGIYYLTYLSENCQKFDVKFETSVSLAAETELTVINLTFIF